MAALLALAAACSFGISDVAGAVAAKRASSIVVSLGLQFAGLPILVIALALLPGAPSLEAVLLGALAGAFGIVGLVLYLRSMAVGPVGVISPVSALMGVAVPVTWGITIAGEVLTTLQVVGVVTGIVAVVLVAWSPGASLRAFGTGGPVIALIAGSLFGLFFVVLDATPTDSGLWPLLGARLSGSVLLVGLLVFVPRPTPTRSLWPLIALSGVTDMGANILFLLATRSGLLSLVSLLASLYPVVALLLAHHLLKERLTPLQAGGVVLALTAIGTLVV